jgi:hypothetical protein
MVTLVNYQHVPFAFEYILRGKNLHSTTRVARFPNGDKYTQLPQNILNKNVPNVRKIDQMALK